MNAEIFGDGKSTLREMVDPACIGLMDGLDDVGSSIASGKIIITPNRMTTGRVAINVLITFFQQQAYIYGYNFNPAELAVLCSFKALAYAGDKFDGSMADVFDKKHPGKHDRSKGQILDTRYDRREEAWNALLRARTAYVEGNLLGEVTADCFALTCIRPSTERARLGTLSYQPPEMGSNFWEFWGARFGRCLLTEAAGWKYIKGKNIQPWFDLAATVANLNTARARKALYDQNQHRRVPPLEDKEKELKRLEKIDFAKARLRDLERVQQEIIGATLATFIALRTLPIELVSLKP